MNGTGSGKQILGRILAELSTKITDDNDMGNATQRLRTGLLVHGSTAEESYEMASRLAWSSSKDKLGSVWRQGIALSHGNYFISDIFEKMTELPELKEWLLSAYPDLDSSDFEACTWAIWLVLSSVQMFEELLSVEVDDVHKIDLEHWVEVYTKHYMYYFAQKGKEHKGGDTND